MKHQNHFQKDLPRGLSIHSNLIWRLAVEFESSVVVKGVQNAVK